MKIIESLKKESINFTQKTPVRTDVKIVFKNQLVFFLQETPR